MQGTGTTQQAMPMRYSGIAQALHWLTAILVVVAFVYGPGGSEQHVYAPEQDAGRHLHETLGLLVLRSFCRACCGARLTRAPIHRPCRVGWVGPPKPYRRFSMSF